MKEQGKMNGAPKNGADYEKRMKELEEIVSKLEDGGLPLEESMSLFERGTALFSECNRMLSDAQLRIDALFEEAGLTKTRRFDLPQREEEAGAAFPDEES